MMAEDLSDVKLIPPTSVKLPIEGPAYDRPDPQLIENLREVGSATASAMLHKMGIRQTFIQGPLPRKPGAKVVGSARTLQFMPQREDIASGAAQENVEKRSALWAVFADVQPGDVLMVQAWGDMHTGCLGEMLATFFKTQGGVGIVVDGCVRDWPHIQEIDMPLWTKGFTPNYASQGRLFPWAYNVPVALSHVMVLPGDVVIADDDGVVVVPVQMAPIVAQKTLEHEDWEIFSRMKLTEGGSLYKYYPLSEEGRREYEDWKRSNGR
jgi:regulator of RNase E activity RraA